MLIAAVLLILTADIGLTWYLLVNYRKRVIEGNPLARWLFKGEMIGNLIFVGARICIAALVIEFMTWAGMVAFSVVTLYAVVNNIIVLRRLSNE